MKETKTAFVSGHIYINDGEFEEHYKNKIEEAAASGHLFVVGDANGIDSEAQSLLKNLLGEKSDRVQVYHMFDSPRNNKGNFATVGEFSNDEERDAAMTAASDYDIAWVRVGKEKSGTAKNINRRAKPKIMREIKFRTWDSYRKEFCEWTNRDPFFSTSHGQVFFWKRTKNEDGSYGGDIILEDFGDRFALQQYTGIKDKHGREIYEGDILRGTMSDFNCYQVFSVQFDVEQGGYRWYQWSLDSLEVIGNIFENPEVLEKHD